MAAVLKSFGVCQRRIEPEEIARKDRKFKDTGKGPAVGDASANGEEWLAVER
jgi:hypothetical protein